jgi:hypothetical protein
MELEPLARILGRLTAIVFCYVVIPAGIVTWIWRTMRPRKQPPSTASPPYPTVPPVAPPPQHLYAAPWQPPQPPPPPAS